MTAIQARATHIASGAHALTFTRQLRSELIKLVTVRGTWWSVGIVAALTIGLAVVATSAISPPIDNIIMAVVAPVQFTMLLAGILGVISVTGEYSTGMIRSTLTANPTRGAVLAAKAAVLAGFMFVVTLVIFLIAALAITPLADSKGMAVAWGDLDATLLPIVSAAASMALFALLGVGLGFAMRSGAGAISATVGILFVLPMIVSLLAMLAQDAEWILRIGDYLPTAAVQNAILPYDGADLSVGEAWLTLAAWPAAALAAAWAVLRGRDA